jgi:hypothetical protein
MDLDESPARGIGAPPNAEDDAMQIDQSGEPHAFHE